MSPKTFSHSPPSPGNQKYPSTTPSQASPPSTLAQSTTPHPLKPCSLVTRPSPHTPHLTIPGKMSTYIRHHTPATPPSPHKSGTTHPTSRPGQPTTPFLTAHSRAIWRDPSMPSTASSATNLSPASTSMPTSRNTKDARRTTEDRSKESNLHANLPLPSGTNQQTKPSRICTDPQPEIPSVWTPKTAECTPEATPWS